VSEAWSPEAFRAAYIASGGSVNSARSYVSYLNRAEKLLGTLSLRDEPESPIEQAEHLPASSWGGVKNRSDSLAALRKFVSLGPAAKIAMPSPQQIGPPQENAGNLFILLREAQRIGASYYRLTGKPLGVTGEVAEYEAADKLGLSLCVARTPWYDAIAPATGRKIQIKGRAVDRIDRYRGMCPAIKSSGALDDVVLVLLDRSTLEAIEIWKAPVASVTARIAGLSSQRRRANGVLAITQFKSIAEKVWE